MKTWFFALSLFFIRCVAAQTPGTDTIFYKGSTITKNPEEADYFKIIEYFDENGESARERIYAMDGQLEEENLYANIKKMIMQPMHRAWYPNRQLKEKFLYKDGKLDGELKIFYPNGAVKRVELYENGERKSGSCFDSLGHTILYYPFNGRARYGLGPEVLQKHIREQFYVEFTRLVIKETSVRGPEGIHVQGVAKFLFKVNKFGVLTFVKLLASPNPIADQALLNAANRLKEWYPATYQGDFVDDEVLVEVYIFAE